MLPLIQKELMNYGVNKETLILEPISLKFMEH